MSDKDIIKVLKEDCCSECSYQTLTVPECKCEGCEFKEAILECISMLERKTSDN